MDLDPLLQDSMDLDPTFRIQWIWIPISEFNGSGSLFHRGEGYINLVYFYVGFDFNIVRGKVLNYVWTGWLF